MDRARQSPPLNARAPSIALPPRRVARGRAGTVCWENRSMHRSLGLLAIALAVAGVAACSDSSGPVETTNVSMPDQCDAASFNAALGAGTCSTQGSVTFAQFNGELNSSHQVAAWRYVPSTLEIHVGQAITAINQGGETHTFTEVDQFGGGIVPSLNELAHATAVAPEGQALEADDFVAPGGTYREQVSETGTVKFQCCIHPWMKLEAQVAAR